MRVVAAPCDGGAMVMVSTATSFVGDDAVVAFPWVRITGDDVPGVDEAGELWWSAIDST